MTFVSTLVLISQKSSKLVSLAETTSWSWSKISSEIRAKWFVLVEMANHLSIIEEHSVFCWIEVRSDDFCNISVAAPVERDADEEPEPVEHQEGAHDEVE